MNTSPETALICKSDTGVLYRLPFGGTVDKSIDMGSSWLPIPFKLHWKSILTSFLYDWPPSCVYKFHYQDGVLMLDYMNNPWLDMGPFTTMLRATYHDDKDRWSLKVLSREPYP